jgi:hypothetical protein
MYNNIDRTSLQQRATNYSNQNNKSPFQEFLGCRQHCMPDAQVAAQADISSIIQQNKTKQNKTRQDKIK